MKFTFEYNFSYDRYMLIFFFTCFIFLKTGLEIKVILYSEIVWPFAGGFGCVRARNIQRAPCVSPSSPLISAQMSRHSCFFSNQFHAEDQAPALIWTLPLLDFCKTTFSYFTRRAVQMEICLTVYRFWRGKSPICKNNLQWHMFGRIISHHLHDECDGNLVRFLARGIRSHFSRSEITPATSGEHEWTEGHFASWKR